MNYQEIYENVLANMDSSYELVYTDYSCNFNNNVEGVESCLSEKSICPLHDDNMWIIEAQSDASYDVLDELLVKLYDEEVVEQMKLEGDHYDNLRCIIVERDTSNPIKDSLRRTDMYGRFQIYSNFDCFVPPYAEGGVRYDSYLQTLMTALCLNPAKFAEVSKSEVIGEFPDIPERNGKEIISYEGLNKCICESVNYGLFSFFGKMNMDYLIDNDFEVKDATIPKGTWCTFFNDWNGGGALDGCETLRDVSIIELKENLSKLSKYDDVSELIVDEKGNKRGYSSFEVYGDRLNSDYLF